MTINTRIYYTGDQANSEGTGTITEITQTKWGLNVTAQMDDGREIFFHSLPADEFSGNCSTRFVTLEAYNTYRQETFKRIYNLDIPATTIIK